MSWGEEIRTSKQKCIITGPTKKLCDDITCFWKNSSWYHIEDRFVRALSLPLELKVRKEKIQLEKDISLVLCIIYFNTCTIPNESQQHLIAKVDSNKAVNIDDTEKDLNSPSLRTLLHKSWPWS